MKKHKDIIYKRVNITLPDYVADEVKNACPYGSVSSFISEAIEEKLQKINAGKLKNELIEGYISSAEDDREINSDYDLTTGDGLND
ncbi:MAG: hypothetical protein NTV87_17115 [Ignavibacteriae bacterium]|jgi:metal-responsive CopG/Arc/MetJ family transcriptional regulator|nr:hypothetical protein [Ignavibacteriota bacterium]